MLLTETINTTCMGCFAQLASSGGICPNCGYNEAAQVFPPHQLRPRTILNGKYLLGKVLGEGGFGITYIGWDLNLYIKVAIKEYYPVGFVIRENTMTNTVQPFTGSQGDFFTKGRERFVDEARRLAKFRSMPGIVSVNDFFIENGTAYIAMEYIEGQTFKSYLAQMGGKLPATQVFDMLRPVMTSLSQVHKSGMIHRDISPDNIMISKDGYVKLLDFGAAREFAESGNRSLSIMLKPGFAPEEQYRSRGVQGPWTDIYALCATIYKAITGVTPDESSERMRRDEVKRPSELGVAIPSALEVVLMKGMAVLQEDRWQSVDELMAALNDAQGYGATSTGLVRDASATTLGSAAEARAVTPGSAAEARAVTPGSAAEARAVTPSSAVEARAVTPGLAAEARAVTLGSAVEARAVTPGSSTNPRAVSVIASYASQQAGIQNLFEPVAQSEMEDSVLYSKSEPKPESDSELTPYRWSDDIEKQPIKGNKTNPIILWILKSKIIGAISAAAIVLIIVVYQLTAGSNEYAYRGTNSNMSANSDAEAKEAGDGDNSANSNSKLSQLPSDLTIGQRNVVFGDYTWRVLDIQDGKALLLTEEIIAQRAYHSENVDITWEDCDLRAYLNGSFLESFTQEEQDAIIEVTNANDDNQWYETEGGDATNDKIFLLSLDEVVTYFGFGEQSVDRLFVEVRIPHEYSEAKNIMDEYDWSWWWLRSPGDYSNCAACVVVATEGEYWYGSFVGLESDGGVRPALWVSQ
jgi:serine/threonine protein kinase